MAALHLSTVCRFAARISTHGRRDSVALKLTWRIITHSLTHSLRCRAPVPLASHTTPRLESTTRLPVNFHISGTQAYFAVVQLTPPLCPNHSNRVLYPRLEKVSWILPTTPAVANDLLRVPWRRRRRRSQPCCPPHTPRSLHM
jgi:hypothetical protein